MTQSKADLVIVRIETTVVPQSGLNAFLAYVACEETPRYETALGLVCLFISHRVCVSYVEVMVFSLWSRDDLMSDFIKEQPPTGELKTSFHAVRLEPRVYDFVTSRDGQFRTADFSSEAAD